MMRNNQPVTIDTPANKNPMLYRVHLFMIATSKPYITVYFYHYLCLCDNGALSTAAQVMRTTSPLFFTRTQIDAARDNPNKLRYIPRITSPTHTLTLLQPPPLDFQTVCYLWTTASSGNPSVGALMHWNKEWAHGWVRAEISDFVHIPSDVERQTKYDWNYS